jgi:hypothetical protein
MRICQSSFSVCINNLQTGRGFGHDFPEMRLDDVLRRGFQACMDDRAYDTGAKVNAHSLGLKAGRSSSSLYAWIKGNAGISHEALDEWLHVLGLTVPEFLERCLGLADVRSSLRSPHRLGVSNETVVSMRRAAQDLLADLAEVDALRRVERERPAARDRRPVAGRPLAESVSTARPAARSARRRRLVR